MRRIKENRGYIPSPRAEVSIEDDYFSRTGRRRQAGVSFSERDAVYLDKLMALAESNGIEVVVMGFLLPKELHDILEETGFNKQYLLFFEILKRKYPYAGFTSEPILFLGNDNFGDMSHLNKKGSAAYTEYFKRRLFLPAAGM